MGTRINNLPTYAGNALTSGFVLAQFLEDESLRDYKLSIGSLPTSSGGGGTTNLGYTASENNGVITNSAGTNATVTLATSLLAGLMSPAQLSKLAGIATGATANDTNAALRDRVSHTGTQAAATISDFSTAADARITASNKVSSNTAPVSGSTQVTNILAVTQAQYNAITPNASTVYFIVGA